MKQDQKITTEGKVVRTLPNASFRVEIPGRDEPILAHISGKMRRYFIRILPGDKVKIELSSYDPDRGRIVYRYK